jgi:uncharacterized protein YukE
MPDVSGSILTVPADLQGAGAYLNRVAATIEGELIALKHQLQPIADTWTDGRAQHYYQGLQWEWNAAADGLFGPTGVLGQIAQRLNLIWDNYTECEWSNTKTWQR